ncbi:hypothetical protein PG984_015698 [Apiospora sp. TS-2023a]
MEPGTGSRRHVPIPATGLTTVVEPSQPSMDIVFVHGFTGHPERTWAKAKGDKEHADDEASASSERPQKMRKFNLLPGSGSSNSHGYRSVFWPRDLLPATAPNARVMTYGYDTNIRHWIGPQVSQNTVYDIAWDFLVSLEASRRSAPTRSIMLIAHSLGGIVVKEMLRRSSMCRLGQSHLHSVFNSTTGIIFFGTPHGGSDPRGIVQSVAERLIKAVGFTVNQQIVDTLLPSSERLRELRDEFAPLASQQGWAIHSFQEQMGVKLLSGRKVVDDTSSYINAPEIEVTEHIGQNHMEMCRFVGPCDTEYRKVSAAVARLMSRKETVVPSLNHTRAPEVDQGALQKIMDSLVFDQHDARHRNIKSAHAKTCKWLLKSKIYGDWVKSKHLEENHGFFWMKGKPGTGKSTIMKFLFANARRTMKDKILISFFFNARGHELERSTTGLYRSLLLQLLEQKPSLQEVLGSDSLRNRGTSGWSLELLKSLFEQAVQSLACTPIVCFVDALDECPETEVREMVSSFSHLGQLAVSAGYEFKVCFSSRHYPHITINKKIELVLEEHEGHGEDISLYVASELNIGQSKLADEIRQTIQTKSSGIFMWVVLVVQILNKEYDSGNVHKLRRRLKEIPEDLHDLFRDILTRDARNGKELVLCLQWVLFAKDPLKPKELYFAVLSGADSEALKDYTVEDLSDSDVDRYILNCSKGLIETTKSRSCTAQFIHESVRDFLLKDDGFRSVLEEETNGIFEGLGHEKLKQCCLAQMEIASRDNDPEMLLTRFPFLRYAVDSILYHADRAEKLGVSQSEFLTKFHTAAWVKLNNSCEKYQARKYPAGARLLYILAEKNFSHLVTILPTGSSYLEMGQERYLCPLYAAMAMGSHDAAKVLLWRRVEILPATHEARRYFTELFSRKEPWPAFSRQSNFQKKGKFYDEILQSSEELMLFFISAGLISEEQSHANISDIFQLAYYHRRQLVVLRLLESTTRDQIVLWKCGNLHQAAQWDLPEVASKLLETMTTKAEIDARDETGRTPLSYAAGSYSVGVTRLLLNTGLVDVNSRDNNGRSPLLHAAEGMGRGAAAHNKETTIKLLLDSGKADIGSCDNYGESAIFLTLGIGPAEHRKRNMKILLSYGKEEAKRINDSGHTCLSYAMAMGRFWAAEILLTSGEADVDARDRQGRTPLSWLAGKMGDYGESYINEVEQAARTLVQHGADINTQDNSGRTPLSWAITVGKPYNGDRSRSGESPSLKGVYLLLELGADPAIPDVEGLTPYDRVGGDREQEVRDVLAPLTFGKSSFDVPG